MHEEHLWEFEANLWNIYIILLGKKSAQIARFICLPTNYQRKWENSPNSQQTETSYVQGKGKITGNKPDLPADELQYSFLNF